MEKILSNVKRIHLIGIGGIGMSGLALLLKEKGFSVSGSDIEESDTLKTLREAGIQVYIHHKPAYIEGLDLVCYSSAIKEDNVELLETKRKNIPLIKRAQLLALIAFDKKTIAVAGAHGKTTTAALLGFLLSSLGYKPTVFVGGIPLDYNVHAFWGSEYFVIEVDESDGSFLFYNPWASIITNIDYEHLDYYQTIDRVREAFLKFAYQTKNIVIGCGDSPDLRDIILKVEGITYGYTEASTLRAANISFDGCFTSFDCFLKEVFVEHVSIPLLGEHNVLNTLAILSFFYYIGEDLVRVIGFVKDFKGTKRRFQIKKRVGGVTFVDDYAHHPTEIEAVLKGAQYLKPKRLFVIFQPHRFSRVKLLSQEFAQCFALADRVVITDIYAASETPLEGISAQFLCAEIKKHFQSITYIPQARLIEEVPLLLEEGDLVLGLGAGTINMLMEEIIHEFEKNRIKV